MRQIVILITFLFFSFALLSQGEIEDIVSYNKSEQSGSILINSNGWGGNFRFGKRLNGLNKRLIDIDFVGIKHPKEQKIQHPKNDSKFVFGKLNSLFVLRINYGFQKEIFSKFDKGGIAIKYFYLGGPSLGLVKPVYYEVITKDPDGIEIINVQKFNSSSIHTIYDIYGQSSFFNGLEEINVIPGASFKLGLSFEYGRNIDVINAIEVGTMLDIYLNEIQIMDLNSPNRYFISLFIAYRYGKTIGSIKD